MSLALFSAMTIGKNDLCSVDLRTHQGNSKGCLRVSWSSGLNFFPRPVPSLCSGWTKGGGRKNFKKSDEEEETQVEVKNTN